MSALESARERLQPVFERIGATSLEREQSRTLPTEAVRDLRDAGFGRLRIPVEFGGDGLSWPDFAELLIELAALDSNLPQIFRGHIAYVEDLIAAAPGPRRERWLRRLAAGDLVGNAWSEVGSGAIGASGTVVSEAGDGSLRVDGRKFYTTGSIFADWIDATATKDGTDVTVLIPRHQEGVTVLDDWDGFGQPLTGTGTAIFESAEVSAEDVAPFADRFRYQTAVYQLVLVSVLAGIAAAVERDVAEQIRARTRVYSHGTAARTHEDPQILQIVGELSAVAAVARASVLEVARAVERAAALADDRDSADAIDAVVEAEFASAQSQVVLTDLVPRAATRLFDTLGASAISGSKSLDRHWRNARAVASHNPWIFKARQLGDRAVTGAVPDFIWAVGVAAPK
ncbi:alkylation response protein AidB-like acyl-CoA dehydrogenase [Microbacteriaceae bacterium SG_E_30_P1]|uniref:Alkylation response protein AidB-like acyl-CoA dehydrogenase n=1 Tax=Antiquaquibacter oligotrophicus TaxID=2880260 RepID=A0ABT6KPD0_9MICO|nr:acyl-CoA dehydrogenase family protein [Antiquaquibacter oligotrophicus]MDH6181714.1 alkylation response protein AidB-like acyl-CoA dehydrogenase [Antiquaquibacter oligotrophicus]UDF12603.1 acyl-CoA dehydrogenase family protein [Antiquaquibacter oligotrophicus]